MTFSIGEKVIHSSFGLGQIVRIEDKPVDGVQTRCYVFQRDDLMLWIPVDKVSQHNLRKPVPPEEFARLYAILRAPPQKLEVDRVRRIQRMTALARQGDLASLCRLVRDTARFKQDGKLSGLERFLLSHAEKTLLTEWSYSLEISINQAYRSLMMLLEEGSRQEIPSAYGETMLAEPCAEC